MDPQQLQLLVDMLAKGQLTQPQTPLAPGVQGPPGPSPAPGALSPEMLAQLQAQMAAGPPPALQPSTTPANMSMLERFLSTLSNMPPSSAGFGGGPYQP